MAKQTSRTIRPPKPVRKCVLQFRVTQEIYDRLALAGQKHDLTISMEAVRRLEAYEKHAKAIEQMQNTGNPEMSLGIPRKILEGFTRLNAERIAVRAAEIAIRRITETKVPETA